MIRICNIYIYMMYFFDVLLMQVYQKIPFRNHFLPAKLRRRAHIFGLLRGIHAAAEEVQRWYLMFVDLTNISRLAGTGCMFQVPGVMKDESGEICCFSEGMELQPPQLKIQEHELF